MAISRGRLNKNDNLTWPGFVDALAALLMVVIFVLMIFSLAQFYLNQIVSGQDEALVDLNNEISNLYNLLQIEKNENTDLEIKFDKLSASFNQINTSLIKTKQENDALSQVIMSLKNSLSEVKSQLDQKKIELQNQVSLTKNKNTEITSIKLNNEESINFYEKKILELEEKLIINRDELAIKIDDILQLQKLKTNLQIEINDLISNNKEINSKILQERDYSKTLEEKIASLKDKALLSQKENNKSLGEIVKLRAQINSMKIALSQVNLKLSQLQALFEKLKTEDEKNKIETASLGKELNSALASRVKELQKFRSEFFGRLSELLENREEIRIVGDRFVFQSELLFEKGSANLGKKGYEQLNQLFITLDDIGKTIPNDINWVLQVEGHTDNIPIRAGKYLDNWHLSTERALSVVRFLIDKGTEPKRLSATGYGEFQPLRKLDSNLSLEEINSKNRRIELKITQRIID
jgi:chemotaxis protein MotB